MGLQSKLASSYRSLVSNLAPVYQRSTESLGTDNWKVTYQLRGNELTDRIARKIFNALPEDPSRENLKVLAADGTPLDMKSYYDNFSSQTQVHEGVQRGLPVDMAGSAPSYTLGLFGIGLTIGSVAIVVKEPRSIIGYLLFTASNILFLAYNKIVIKESDNPNSMS